MEIRRSDLQRSDEPQVLRATLFDIGISDLGDSDTPVEVELQVHCQDEDFLVRGKLHTVLALACDRCLGNAPTTIKGEFTAWLTAEIPPDSDEAEDEWILFPAYQESVDISEIVSRTIYLDLPRKTLCREDCQGLCPVCGIDRNQKTCECKDTEMDERWAALLSVKQKLEE